MIQNQVQNNIHPESVITGNGPYSYPEVVTFLNNNWPAEPSLSRIKALDSAFGSPSKSINAIFVAGTNGKSLTINFATKLLHAEGLTVGSFYAPHIASYQERIVINRQVIAQSTFTELANQVLTMANTHNIAITSGDLITMIALLHFKNHNVDVAVLEVGERGVEDPITICTPSVVAITRVTDRSCTLNEKSERLSESKWRTIHELPTKPFVDEIIKLVQPNTWVVSADQSKIHLQYMEDLVKERNAHFAMPIRKLAVLPYPFEQLHGRSAALAERLAQLYVEKYVAKDASYMANSLLTKPKGPRGRPPIDKNAAPKRTLLQFWNGESLDFAGRFQFLSDEKPLVLLDNASNIDALKNLLLGVRLLHYQNPSKGLAIILGAHEGTFDLEELEKQMRYFFKRTVGTLIVCPVTQPEAAPAHRPSWDYAKVADKFKEGKIKTRIAKNFADAFELAKKSVDEQKGLVVVTGSAAVVNEYQARTNS